jgi:hypothetical protein
MLAVGFAAMSAGFVRTKAFERHVTVLIVTVKIISKLEERVFLQNIQRQRS